MTIEPPVQFTSCCSLLEFLCINFTRNFASYIRAVPFYIVTIHRFSFWTRLQQSPLLQSVAIFFHLISLFIPSCCFILTIILLSIPPFYFFLLWLTTFALPINKSFIIVQKSSVEMQKGDPDTMWQFSMGNQSGNTKHLYITGIFMVDLLCS